MSTQLKPTSKCKYTDKLDEAHKLSLELDKIDNYIKQNQIKYTLQLDQCIRIFQLSNMYASQILENNNSN